MYNVTEDPGFRDGCRQVQHKEEINKCNEWTKLNISGIAQLFFDNCFVFH